jgi:two-component system, NtrC family, sensor histidine kinase PilS
VPSSSPLSGGLGDFRVRLLWLNVFRTVATTLLLVVLAVQLTSRSREAPTPTDFAAFALVGVVYLLTLVTSIWIRIGTPRPSLIWVQIVFDVALAGGVVTLSGGLESPFGFLFSLAIIGASVLRGRRGAVVAAVLSVSTHVSVLLPSLWAHQSARQLLELGIQLLAQVMIAVLAGYVSEQLLRTEGRASAREEDLKQLTQLQNLIVTAMPSGLMSFDLARRVTFINPAAQAILGVDEGLVGTDIVALLPGIEAVGAAGTRRSELQVDTLKRGRRTLGLSVAPLAGQGGTLVVFQDLTEMRRLENELERIDRLASLGRMSAQLAHEIRNPLASMRGSAQLLAGDLSNSVASSRLARLIMREADRLAGLVEGYLKLARPPPPVKQTVRIDQAIRETVEMLKADAAMAGVSIELAVTPLESEVDAGQLKQVLINLLRNAVTATEGRGRIRVSSHAEGDRLKIEVWDSAGSLRAEDRDRIFEPFFTRHADGTGLGLSTVRSIVHAHGGSISVDSAPERGTTFCVQFERTPKKQPGSRDGGPG